MTRWMCRVALVAATVTWAGGAARAADPAAVGLWVVQDGKAAVAIAPCGDKLCGAITWLKTPLNDQGKPKTDIHNSDKALQARLLCGLQMLSGFAADGDNAWSGGQIYDAEHGDLYSSNMRVQDDGTLKVRGYIGFSLLGKSQVWTRATTALPHC